MALYYNVSCSDPHLLLSSQGWFHVYNYVLVRTRIFESQLIIPSARDYFHKHVQWKLFLNQDCKLMSSTYWDSKLYVIISGLTGLLHYSMSSINLNAQLTVILNFFENI